MQDEAKSPKIIVRKLPPLLIPMAEGEPYHTGFMCHIDNLEGWLDEDKLDTEEFPK